MSMNRVGNPIRRTRSTSQPVFVLVCDATLAVIMLLTLVRLAAARPRSASVAARGS
jgi:hypothetical protein